MAAINGAFSISVADLAAMDIETALMTVQTQRANLLEAQLKDQMEAVRARNEQINALNSILAEVRKIRPGGKSDDKANTSSGGGVQVPITGTSTIVDQLALAAAQAELKRLEDLKEGKVTTTTGGSGGDGYLTVPSDFKPTAPAGSAAEPYAKALSEFVDTRKSVTDANGTFDSSKAESQDVFRSVAGNSVATDGFVDYYNSNKALFDQKYGKDQFHPGFDKGSDQNDVAVELATEPKVRAEFETYLRLAVQGGGTAAPPGTKIIDTASGAKTTTTTTTDIPKDIDAQIQAQKDKIAALQAGQQANGTTFQSMTLDGALAFYGFKSGNLTQTEFDQLIQTISSRIDGLNSTQQLDMLRLQSLTNKRNEAFDIMTNFIKKMQDGRSNIVGNMR